MNAVLTLSTNELNYIHDLGCHNVVSHEQHNLVLFDKYLTHK